MKLIIYAKGRAEEIPLEATIVVGRGPNCEFRLHDPSVSTRHAQFGVDGEKVTLTDLNSTNGTFVNEERLGGISVIFSCGDTSAPPEGVSEESQILAPIGEAEDGPATDDEPTPVDESFAPEEQQSDSPRPELLARDGKWYLREKTSGKEVEIVPVRKGRPAPSAAEVSGQVKDFMHANTLAAAVAILVVGAIFVFVLRSILIIPPPPPGAWHFPKYASAVRRSVVEIDAGEYARAEYFLSTAASKYGDAELAKTLLDLVGVFKDAQSRRSLPKMQRALSQVGRYAGKDFKDIAAWASSRLRALKTEYRFEEMFSEAQQLINAGQLKPAAELLSRIPQKSKLHTQAQKMIAEIQGTIWTASLDMANGAIAKQDWSAAVNHLLEAQRNGAPTAQVKTKLEMCRRNERDKDRLAKANGAYEKGQYPSALAFIEMIGQGSPYHADGVALRGRIRFDSVVNDAKVFYARGDWKGALELLASVDNPACTKLAEHIKSVKKAYDASEKAYEEQKIEEAIGLWEQVVALEKDPQNFFNLQAQKRLAVWKDKPEKIAELRWPKVEAAEAKENYVEARKQIQAIFLLVPDYKPGLDKLKDYQEKAENLFQKAMNLHSKPAEAVRLYQTVIDLLPAEHAYAKRAKEEIKLLIGKVQP